MFLENSEFHKHLFSASGYGLYYVIAILLFRLLTLLLFISSSLEKKLY